MSTNDPLTQEQLDAIRERLDAATEGPWMPDNDEPGYVIAPGDPSGWDGYLIASTVDHDGGLFVQEHNAELIAHAPQDLTALLAEVERLRNELAKAREVTDEKITEAISGSMEVNCELRVMENMLTTWCEAHDSEVDAADRCFHVWDIVEPALTAALGGGDDA